MYSTNIIRVKRRDYSPFFHLSTYLHLSAYPSLRSLHSGHKNLPIPSTPAFMPVPTLGPAPSAAPIPNILDKWEICKGWIRTRALTASWTTSSSCPDQRQSVHPAISQRSFLVGHRHAISAKLHFHPLHVERAPPLAPTVPVLPGAEIVTRLKSTLWRARAAGHRCGCRCHGGVDAEERYVANIALLIPVGDGRPAARDTDIGEVLDPKDATRWLGRR
ncbi:hypothetical protein V8E52_011128 [Russula decolorans]